MTDRHRGGSHRPARGSPRRPTRPAAARIAVLPFIVAALALPACAPPPSVGGPPSPQVPMSAPTATPTPTESAAAYRIDIFIDAQTVTPLRRTVALEQGRTVVLVFRSDHDVTVTIAGAGIEKNVFVARLARVTESFVVDQLGVVTISTTDPAATIAELSVV